MPYTSASYISSLRKRAAKYNKGKATAARRKAYLRGAFPDGYGTRLFGSSPGGIELYGANRRSANASQLAARKANHYTGRGLYSGRGLYDSNSLVVGGRPSMEIDGGGDNQNMIISHKEYLQDIYGPSSASFTNESLSINPGLMTNFPWLSQIASNYEEYEFIQLIFEYHPTVDAISTNNEAGTTGTLVMATNYNPDAAAFESKEVMMQYHGASSGRIIDRQIHGVECDPAKNAGPAIRFVRSMIPMNNQSLKDFDLGTFQWAISNIPAGFEDQQLGELWCHYQVKVSKPRLYNSVFRDLPLQQWVMPFVASDTLTAGQNTPNAAVVFNGVTPPVSVWWGNSVNSLGIQLSNSSSADTSATDGLATVVYEFTFPDFMTGSYMIQIYLSSAPNAAGWQTCTQDEAHDGNVSFLADLGVAGTPGSSTAQQQPVLNELGFQHNTPWVTATDTPAVFSSSTHIRVEPSTGGDDNTCTLTLSLFSRATGGQIKFANSSVYVYPYNKLNADKFVQSSNNIALN